MTGCIPFMHVAVGIAVLSGGMDDFPDGPPPAFFGWVFLVGGVFAIGFSWTMAVLVLVAGRMLAARRSYRFCFVVACIVCINVPLGTALGVFTIIVLLRPSVKRLFGVPVSGAMAADERE